jgi:hypothetical protein
MARLLLPLSCVFVLAARARHQEPVEQDWHTDLAAATELALEAGRPLLVVFR